MMISKFALFSNLLLASATLAVPSSQQGARIAHPQEDHQSQSVESFTLSVRAAFIDENTYWAGASVDNSFNAFHSVNGTFTVPTIIPSSDGVDCGVTVYVGVDSQIDSTCPAILAGIQARVTNKVPSYSAWIAYHPPEQCQTDSYDITSDPPINAGDSFTVSTRFENATVITVVFEDHTTGWSFTRQLEVVASNGPSTNPFCGFNVKWAVGYFGGIHSVPLADGMYSRNVDVGITNIGSLNALALADFGIVNFTHAVLTNNNGPGQNPLDAHSIGMIVAVGRGWDERLLTFVAPGQDSLLVQYLTE